MDLPINFRLSDREPENYGPLTEEMYISMIHLFGLDAANETADVFGLLCQRISGGENDPLSGGAPQ